MGPRRRRHVVVERCSPEMKRQLDVWGDSLEGEDIMRRIKHSILRDC